MESLAAAAAPSPPHSAPLAAPAPPPPLPSASPSTEAPAGEVPGAVAAQEPSAKRRKKNLSNDERRAMAEFLLQRSQGGARLPHSAIAEAAAAFQVHRNTASRIWQLLKPSLPSVPGAVAVKAEAADASAAAAAARTAALLAPAGPARLSEDLAKQVLSRKRNSGRKKKDYSAEMARLKELPMHQRGSLRALASAVGVPRTTLFRILRDEEGSAGAEDAPTAEAAPLPTQNTVKPPLSGKNKIERLRFCGDKVRDNGHFDDMINVVHLNLRQFQLCGSASGSPNETAKRRARVTFLFAFARPQWDPQRSAPFDGKIGAWPFLSAANSDDDQPVPVIVETATKAEIQQLLVAHVLPAIREKLPHHGQVLVQLDSQHVRLPPDDPVVATHGSVNGWNMRLQYQPAYSPDLVVLDHAFFHAIEQSVKDSRPETLNEMIVAIDRAMVELPKRRITDGFLALQKKMEATMRARGSNVYELAGRPTKRSLQLDGSIPISVVCDPEALLACRAGVDSFDQAL